MCHIFTAAVCETLRVQIQGILAKCGVRTQKVPSPKLPTRRARYLMSRSLISECDALLSWDTFLSWFNVPM